MKVSSRKPAKGGASAKGASAKAVVTPSHRRKDIAGVLMFALAVVVTIALITPDSGVIGRSLGAFFTGLFGAGAWGVPVLFAAIGTTLIRGRGAAVAHAGTGLTLIFLAVLAALARPLGGDYFDPDALNASGGYVGAVLGWACASLLGAAKLVGIGAIGLVGLVLTVDVPIREMLAQARDRARDVKHITLDRPRSRQSNEDRIRPLKRSLEEASRPVSEPEGEAEARDEPRRSRKETIFHDLTAEGGQPTLSGDASEPKEGYRLPPATLLAEAILKPKRSQAEMQKNIEILENTLAQFGIEADVVEVATGPTVTRYEIQLGPGIKVNRITALADNIAMDLAASQVRVEAPIPGKAAIGVEVPNVAPSVVTLRELIDDQAFRGASKLCVALGKDVSGVNKYADLSKMPHLLIGGATNSGKSIGLATLITSLLMRNTPKDVRLVLVDPKRVELTLFDQVPHLMCPVVKDVKEAAGVLRAVCREMDRRYDMLSEHGVRNIQGWNEKASFQDRMPYIVVVVDELADLMIAAKAEVETAIVRLAQLARAVGIHIVIATQRPSVDVITGIIKANIPSRIAFSVASQIDSRTIIDTKGAENLIGKGDMLFQPIDAIKPLRVQGCYVSEKEIEAVCQFWRSQEKPQYVINPVEEAVHDERREAGDFDEETDPLWEEAIRWAVDRGQASTSMLQRKFSIGFQRASRLLDQMEERGIVGARDGPRPREVLVSHLDVDSLFGQGPKYDVGRTIGDGLDE